MELRHLKYFIAVAEELHFARAAERLNISAPTLSHQISALETMLGAKLLTRKTKTAVALTNAGKRFLTAAREAVKQASYAEMVGREAARGAAGSISLAYVLSAACSGLVSTALGKFRALHPDVAFSLARVSTTAQFKGLVDGTLDVGFSRMPARYPTGLTGFIIEQQPFVAALPEAHPLAARKQITPAMLVDEPFIAISLESELGFWSNIASITPPGAAMKIVDRAADAFSVMVMIGAGVGISVLSESLSCIALPGVVFRKLVGAERTSDHVVVYRKNESAPVVTAFIDFMRAQVNKR